MKGLCVWHQVDGYNDELADAWHGLALLAFGKNKTHTEKTSRDNNFVIPMFFLLKNRICAINFILPSVLSSINHRVAVVY